MNLRYKFLSGALFSFGVMCVGSAIAASLVSKAADAKINCENGACKESNFQEVDVLTRVIWMGRWVIGVDMPETFVPLRATKANAWLAKSKEYGTYKDGLQFAYDLSEKDCVALFPPESFDKGGAYISGYVINPYAKGFDAAMNTIEGDLSKWYVAIGSSGARAIHSEKILSEWKDKNSTWDKQIWTKSDPWESFSEPLCRKAEEGLAVEMKPHMPATRDTAN